MRLADLKGGLHIFRQTFAARMYENGETKQVVMILRQVNAGGTVKKEPGYDWRGKTSVTGWGI